MQMYIKGIAGAAVMGAVLTFVTTILSLVLFSFFFKFLEPEEVGFWLVLLSVGAYINLLDFGLSPTLSREIAFLLGGECVSDGNRRCNVANVIKASSYFYRWIAGIVFSVGLLIVSQLELALEGTTNLKLVILIFIAGTSLGLFGNAAIAGLYGIGRVATERIIRVGVQILGFALSLGLLYLGFGLIGLAIAFLLQQVGSRLIAILMLRSILPEIKHHKRIENARGILNRMALPSIKLAVTMLGAVLVFKTDNLIIGSMLGIKEIPVYESVVKVVIAIITLSFLLTSSATPYVSRLYREGDYIKIRNIILKSVRLILSVVGIGIIVFIGCSDDLITVWLGAEYFAGFSVVIPLSILAILEIHHVIHANAMMAAGQLIFHWITLVSGMINVLLSILLIQEFGLMGVAVGTMLSQLITNNWYAPYKSLKFFRICFSEYWKNGLKPAVEVCGSVLILVLATRLLMPELMSMEMRVFTIVCAGLMGIFLIYIRVLSSEEKIAILSMLKNLMQYRSL